MTAILSFRDLQENSFTISGMRHEFEVIRLWKQDYSDFLDFPGLLPLAVLGRSDNRTQTLREISSVISTIEDRRQQSNVAAATSILAGLVLEKDVVRGILREETMRESVIYQDIKAQGKAEGIKEGIKEGEVSLVLRQLNRRIGEVTPEEESQISALSRLTT